MKENDLKSENILLNNNTVSYHNCDDDENNSNPSWNGEEGWQGLNSPYLSFIKAVKSLNFKGSH